jgi:hypothetical protein
MNDRSDERLSTADIAAGGQQSTTAGDQSATNDEAARVEAQERAMRQLEERERTTAPGDATQGGAGSTGGGTADERPAPLFTEEDAESYRGRWREMQAGFVDDPRNAVQLADSMVAELMQKLAEGFASQRATLEQQWDRQGEPSTEDLRVTLRRYRSFFDRLLSL